MTIAMTSAASPPHASSNTVFFTAGVIVATKSGTAFPDATLEAGEPVPGHRGRPGGGRRGRRGWRLCPSSSCPRYKIGLRNPLRQPREGNAARGRRVHGFRRPPALVPCGTPAGHAFHLGGALRAVLAPAEPVRFHRLEDGQAVALTAIRRRRHADLAAGQTT